MVVVLISEIFAFFYLLVITITYILKPKLKSYENRFFQYILADSFVGIVLEIVATIGLNTTLLDPTFVYVINKMYMSTLILYCSLMSQYVYSSVKNDKLTDDYEKTSPTRLIFIAVEGLFLILNIFIPIDYVSAHGFYGDIVFCDGAGIYFIVGTSCLYFICDCILLNKYKNIKRNRYSAVIATVIMFVCLLCTYAARMFFPGLTVLFNIIIYCDLVMYFLIQNPDVVKVNELNGLRHEVNTINEKKSKFLNIVSHDVRSYLQPIVVLSNEMMDGNLDAESKEEVKDILYASDTLLDVMNNILDINKIESNEFVLNNEVYDIKKEIYSLAHMASTRIGDKPINFVINIDQDIPNYVLGDRVRVKQILNNLLSNAFKYTEKGSVVLDVIGKNEDGVCHLSISVKDTGIGIKDTSRLFNKFDRMDMDKNSNIEGTGLGLVITKRYAELLGGSLNVESVYGEGSTFTFKFDQKVDSSKLVASSLIVGANYSGKKILICDEDDLCLSTSKRILSKYNFKIDSCKTGREVINNVRTNKYDVIFLDIYMPDMDGNQTLTVIKDLVGDTPIVALTADSMQGAKEKYLKNGFNGYLSKPLKKSDVDMELHKIFKE